MISYFEVRKKVTSGVSLILFGCHATGHHIPKLCEHKNPRHKKGTPMRPFFIGKLLPLLDLIDHLSGRSPLSETQDLHTAAVVFDDLVTHHLIN